MHSPLHNKRVLVTRPEAQAEGFCGLLEEEGALPIRLPVIRIEPMPDEQLLRDAMSRLREYRWIVFTSVNGVEHACKHLQGSLPAGTRAAAIGPATARALGRHSVPVCYMPDEYRAESLAEGLAIEPGDRVLLPRAEGARRILVDMLQEKGATVDELAAYRTLPVRPGASAVTELIKGVDVVTLSSPSSARNLVDMAREIPSGPVVCIGPVTARAASKLGYNVVAVARSYTVQGLLAAVKEYIGPGIPDS